MKALVVYYSRTGNTGAVGKEIAKELDCEFEAITEPKNRKGIIGYLSAGKDAMMGKVTKVNGVTKNLEDYDIVIVGSPIWSFTVSSPVRSFLTDKKINNAAFFVTMGSKGDEKAFSEMKKLVGKEPKARMTVLEKDIADGSYKDKVKDFVNKIK